MEAEQGPGDHRDTQGEAPAPLRPVETPYNASQPTTAAPLAKPPAKLKDRVGKGLSNVTGWTTTFGAPCIPAALALIVIVVAQDSWLLGQNDGCTSSSLLNATLCANDQHISQLLQ